MSRTHKTSRYRKSREALLDLAEEIVGRRDHAMAMTPMEAGIMLADKRYAERTPSRSGERHGNQRQMRARMKVSKRRVERRRANRLSDL